MSGSTNRCPAGHFNCPGNGATCNQRRNRRVQPRNMDRNLAEPLTFDAPDDEADVKEQIDSMHYTYKGNKYPHRLDTENYGESSQICMCDEIWNVDANACTSVIPYAPVTKTYRIYRVYHLGQFVKNFSNREDALAFVYDGNRIPEDYEILDDSDF